MATRDVILKALQDWRLSEAPTQIRALDAYDLGLLAEVAARAAEVKPIVRPLSGKLVLPLEITDEQYEAAERARVLDDEQHPLIVLAKHDGWIPKGAEVVSLWIGAGTIHFLWKVAPPSVGTPAEAEACGRRSGLGLGDVEHQHIEEL